MHPAAAWTAQQIVEAFPLETAPRYLLRDRDGVYGADFRVRVASMGIEEVLTAPPSPWQSPYVERVIGSIRSECLDNVVVLHQPHLRASSHPTSITTIAGAAIRGSTWTARSRGRYSRPSRGKWSRSPRPPACTGTTSAAPPHAAAPADHAGSPHRHRKRSEGRPRPSFTKRTIFAHRALVQRAVATDSNYYPYHLRRVPPRAKGPARVIGRDTPATAHEVIRAAPAASVERYAWSDDV